MAQEKPDRLAEWVVLLRNQVPVVRRRINEWALACREEPRLIWETSVVRYVAYCLGGLIAVWAILGVAHGIAPPPPEGAKPEAKTADFHVICSDPKCGHHFVIRRKFGFSRFPVQCPECKRKSGEPARRCNSSTCRGRWVIPRRAEGGLVCPRCGEPLQ